MGMARETRLERRLDKAVARASTPRGAAIVVGTVSVLVTLAAGSLMTVADRNNYPSIGSGLWWSVQTVTTVGYGDNVPTSVAGRLVASLVMVFGIGFLTVTTAAITSTFVSRSRLEQRQPESTALSAGQYELLDRRLARIEAALASLPREPGSSAGGQ
jgi:voltage-gated potassium channel